MDGVPLGQTLIGVAGMMLWAALCGMPALVLYNLANRTRSGAGAWIAMVLMLLVWFPLVTALCLWAVSTMIGLRLT
ncbi:MAG TPA: hypothetical protein VGH99_22560 [Pseudonocardia sp.]|jgi:hypothetical protein